MAIFYDAPVPPDAVTAFIRNVPVPGDLVLSNLFPVEYSDKETIDWSELTFTNRTARFRSFDARAHVAERDTGSDKSMRMVPFSDSLGLGEYERLQLEFARTSGTNQAALVDAIYNDAQRLTRHMHNRVEQAIGDVLVDGKLTINENGLVTEADFGVPAANLITAGTAWTNSAAPILDNLIAAIDVYIAANGFPPGGFLGSRRILRLMQTNTQLINAAVGSAAGRPRINLDQITGLFDSEGIPTAYQVYDSQIDVDGVSTRVIPENRLILLPPNPSDLLAMRYGLSATALEIIRSGRADLTFSDGPGIVGFVDKQIELPFRQVTYVDAVGLPYLKDSRKLMVVQAF